MKRAFEYGPDARLSNDKGKWSTSKAAAARERCPLTVAAPVVVAGVEITTDDNKGSESWVAVFSRMLFAYSGGRRLAVARGSKRAGFGGCQNFCRRVRRVPSSPSFCSSIDAFKHPIEQRLIHSDRIGSNPNLTNRVRNSAASALKLPEATPTMALGKQATCATVNSGCWK